jgi:hypothetical protein
MSVLFTLIPPLFKPDNLEYSEKITLILEMDHLREGNEAIYGNMKCGNQVKSIGGATEETEKKTASGMSVSAHTCTRTTLWHLRDISTNTLYKRHMAPFATGSKGEPQQATRVVRITTTAKSHSKEKP